MMKKRFDNAVKTLQENDRNGSWDQVLRENDYNLKEAYEDLKDLIQYEIDRIGDDEEAGFYIDVLSSL